MYLHGQLGTDIDGRRFVGIEVVQAYGERRTTGSLGVILRGG
jgi:hypothetical protein